MKKKLEEVMVLLQNSSAIVIDDDVLCYASIEYELTGEDDNIFMNVSWNDDGYQFDLTYYERDNKEVEVAGSYIFLKNNQGTEDRITLLVPMFVH